jgi:hypothetical protein
MNKLVKLISWIVGSVLLLFTGIFCYLFLGSISVSEKINWGLNFSQMQAETLGLNWKNVYSNIIGDLGVKSIKIHTQWDWVEGQQGKYFFDDIDWQIKKAEENDVKIIYVLGMKTGRWPECHIPEWAESLSQKNQQEVLLNYISKTVQRYKNSKAIAYWQIENEPFFKFGICPKWYYKSKDFIKEEIALVKKLDSSHKIIISDSGEGSVWFSAAKVGDIVGTTMYREVWAHIADGVGFNTHPFVTKVTYWRKAQIIKALFGKDVICVELQAEPWASKPFSSISLFEQEKTMNIEKFRNNIEYAKSTGLDTFYLWGVEWWYWLKTTQNQPAIWQEAKFLFSK